MEWISVKDRLPDVCGNYLAATTYFDDLIVDDIRLLAWDGDRWVYSDSAAPIDEYGCRCTHWQPLPDPPKE